VISLDGSHRSGSGTIVRYAAALATLKGETLAIRNIRSKRPKPGLRPQHLSALLACARLTRGTLEGANVGSSEILLIPGPKVRGGEYRVDIGTAGSATNTAFTVIPPALGADEPCTFLISGGLFQDNAPSFFHMEHVLFPVLREMGLSVDIRMIKPGYLPKGGGMIEVSVRPAERLSPVIKNRRGKVRTIRGVALSSHLQDQKVSKRMADRCTRRWRSLGYAADIEVMQDYSAEQKGAALQLWAETEGGCTLGANLSGRLGLRAEDLADTVTDALLEDLAADACTDRHSADQLILFAALADGRSEFRIPRATEHVDTNLWLVETILGARTEVRDRVVSIDGIGWPRRHKDN
jgi:RNA 3'-terminal phosphate cyclase (ATP)